VIVESYIFDRDRVIDIPADLGPLSAFQRTAFLSELVPNWDEAIPTRSVAGRNWQYQAMVPSSPAAPTSIDAFPAPVEAINLRLGRRSITLPGHWGPLAHDTNDIKREQPCNHGLRIDEVVLKYGDVDSIAKHRPIGAFKRHVLVIVQNSDLVPFISAPPAGIDSSVRI